MTVVHWRINDEAINARRAFVEKAVKAALLNDGLPDVIVAKSLGTHAVEWAQGHQIPGIWLTPTLDDDRVLEAFKRGTGPNLIIGGTEDRHWRPLAGLVNGNTRVVEYPGADHFLEAAGWEQSVELHKSALNEIESQLTAWNLE